MRPDNAKELSKILLDIETVPQHFKWSDLDERTAELFSTKTRFEQERSEKTAEELWSEKGGCLAQFGKIICIGVGSIHKSGETEALRVTSFQGDDEAELLRRFVELLTPISTRMIIGFAAITERNSTSLTSLAGAW